MSKQASTFHSTPASGAPAALPAGIEIFRVGRHIDDGGNVHSFGEAELADMAASYNPALREAPLTVGHPVDNLPAYGWVKTVGRNAAGALAIDAHQVEPQFAEMVAAGRFKKRSASFYPPAASNNPTPGRWYLRHVAFLGAQPPAVAGLKDIQFSAGDAEGAVSFSEETQATPSAPPIKPKEPEDMSKELQAQLDDANAKLKAAQDAAATAQADADKHKKAAQTAADEAKSYAEKARSDRHASYVSFADTQVKAGKLLPKDKAMAVASLDALADAAPVEFSEGDTTRKVSPAQWLQGLIAGGAPSVNFGEQANGRVVAGLGKDASDDEIAKAAQAHAAKNKVSFAEGLTAVTASFTA